MIFYYIIIQLFASEITSFHFDNNSDEGYLQYFFNYKLIEFIHLFCMEEWI